MFVYELSGCGLESCWILNLIHRGIGSETDLSSSKDAEGSVISWINHESFKYKTKCLNSKASKVQRDTDLQFTPSFIQGRNPCSSICRSTTMLKGQNHRIQVEREKNFLKNFQKLCPLQCLLVCVLSSIHYSFGE